MTPREAIPPTVCTRCHRAAGALVQSPFTAERLCPECLRRESALLTRLRKLGTGHHAIACGAPTEPGGHVPREPSVLAR